MTIRCDRICLRDGGRDILRALSLDIPFGGPLSIVGPAGAGKSALFRVLAGQLRPYAGRLQVHGREVALDGTRNSQVALVDVRSTNYPGFTVWENIAVPLRMARSKLLEEQVITLARFRFRDFFLPAGGKQECATQHPDRFHNLNLNKNVNLNKKVAGTLEKRGKNVNCCRYLYFDE